jgi:hypothetical protein
MLEYVDEKIVDEVSVGETSETEKREVERVSLNRNPIFPTPKVLRWNNRCLMKMALMTRE